MAAIAIATGALFLLVAILKLGWLASFLSRAVVTGFLAGAAIDVVIGELPKLTGTSSDGVNAWQELASWVRGLGDLSAPTLLVGLVALAVILGLRFTLPKVPGALVLVVGGLAGVGRCSTSARVASRWSARCHAACRCRRCRRSSSCRRTSRPSSSRPSPCC